MGRQNARLKTRLSPKTEKWGAAQYASLISLPHPGQKVKENLPNLDFFRAVSLHMGGFVAEQGEAR